MANAWKVITRLCEQSRVDFEVILIHCKREYPVHVICIGTLFSAFCAK